MKKRKKRAHSHCFHFSDVSIDTFSNLVYFYSAVQRRSLYSIIEELLLNIDHIERTHGRELLNLLFTNDHDDAVQAFLRYQAETFDNRINQERDQQRDHIQH